jgi:hypothetical protein
MEYELLGWIGNIGSEAITRQMIRKKAIQLSHDSGFKASKGWFERFMNRNREVIKGCNYGPRVPPLKIESQ